MPYVKHHRKYLSPIKPAYVKHAESAGDLNYQFTLLALNYIKRHGYNYQAMNDVMGALEGAKLELYRRHIAPYEDKKIRENGDVK